MFWQYLSVLVLISSVLASPKLICIWIRGNGKVSDIDPYTCTHVHYSYVTLDPKTHKIRFDDVSENHLYVQDVQALKAQNHGLKIVASIGGAFDGADGKYGELVLHANLHAIFVASVIQFLNDNKFDGLDFDWEYPACPNGYCSFGYHPEKDGFVALLRELKTAFGNKYTLSVVVSASDMIAKKAYVYTNLANVVDYINVLTYDYGGPWDEFAIHHSDYDMTRKFMNAWAHHGIPKQKLIMGIPFYGIEYRLQNSSHHHVNDHVTARIGAVPYSVIRHRIMEQKWLEALTGLEHGPYIYLGYYWIGYETPASVMKKANWVKEHGFGGVMVLDVSQDDITGAYCKQTRPLVHAVGFGLFAKGANPASYACLHNYEKTST